MQVCLRVEADARGEVSYNAHYATHLPTGEAGSVGRARWWRRRSVAEHALITIAEAMPVVFNRRRWHGWIAETRMPGGVGRPTGGDIATRRFNPIVKAVLRNFGIAEWRRRRSIDHGLRVRATGQCEGQRQNCKCKCFAHKETPSIEIFRTTNLKAEREAVFRIQPSKSCSLDDLEPGFEESVALFADA